jgi:hypothetical protein
MTHGTWIDGVPEDLLLTVAQKKKKKGQEMSVSVCKMSGKMRKVKTLNICSVYKK